MGYKVRTIEYNESAVSQALDSLFEYSFKASEGAKNRKASISAQREQNEFTKSQVFLENSLENLKNVKEEISQLKTTAAEHGLTNMARDKLTDADRTSAFQDITDAGQSEINSALKSLYKVKDSWSGVVSDYNRGRNLANSIDAMGDSSGAVNMSELSSYAKSQGQKGERVSKAFEMGVANWTLSPEVRQELELKEFDIKTAEKEFKFLDQKLIDEEAIRGLTYNQQVQEVEKLRVLNEVSRIEKDYLKRIGIQNREDLEGLKIDELRNQLGILKIQKQEAQVILDALPKKLEKEQEIQQLTLDTGAIQKDILSIEKEFTREELEAKQKKVKNDLALQKVAIISSQTAIQKATLDYDAKRNEELINSIDMQIANNSENQAFTGASLMSNISLIDINGEDVLTPLSSITSSFLGEAGGQTSDGQSWSELIQEDEYNRYPTIKGEIADLVSSVVVGKSEDQIPDYSVFINKVEEIAALKPAYQEAVTQIRESDMYKQEMAKPRKFKSGKLYTEEEKDAAIVKSLLEETQLGVISDGQRKAAIRYAEWDTTGIYDDEALLEQVLEAGNQRRALNESKIQLMQAHQLDTASLKSTQPIKKKKNNASDYTYEDWNDMTSEEFMNYLER